jgi:hypothetical protein
MLLFLSPTGKIYGLFNKEPIEYKSEDLAYVSSDENKDFLSKSHEMNQETLQSSRFLVEINNLQSSRFLVEINNRAVL